TPRWLAARGGWAEPITAERFARFCGRAASHLGDLVGRVCTLNEPNIVAEFGYRFGLFPPGRRDAALRERVNAIFIDAHRRAVVVAPRVPLLVTENGIGTDEDAERIEYVERALRGVVACLADGLDVRGYVYWSLLDNFEWAFGYRPKFGLVAVDRETQARHP